MGKNKLWKALITCYILSFLGGYVKGSEAILEPRNRRTSACAIVKKHKRKNSATDGFNPTSRYAKLSPSHLFQNLIKSVPGLAEKYFCQSDRTLFVSLAELFVSLSEVEGATIGLSHFDSRQCDNPIDVIARSLRRGNLLH